jgi:hypothetical protein
MVIIRTLWRAIDSYTSVLNPSITRTAISKEILVEIFTFNPDVLNNKAERASSRRQFGFQNGHLAYSYDGKWLLFSSERIADGMLIRLTHNKWEEGVSSWEAPLK